MKTCPVCGETYSERIDFCFEEGAELFLLQSAMDAPMPRLMSARVSADTLVAQSLTQAGQGVEVAPRRGRTLPAPPPVRQPGAGSGKSAVDAPTPRFGDAHGLGDTIAEDVHTSPPSLFGDLAQELRELNELGMESAHPRKGILPWILAGAVVGVLLAFVIIQIRAPGSETEADAVAELEARTPPAQAVPSVAPPVANDGVPQAVPVPDPVVDEPATAGARPTARRKAGAGEATPANPWSAPAATKVGRLSISSEPSGATAFVDGRLVGITPVTVDLPYGTYDVRIQHEDGKPRQKRVPLQSPEFSVPFTALPSRP